jgi:hypothetical protein
LQIIVRLIVEIKIPRCQSNTPRSGLRQAKSILFSSDNARFAYPPGIGTSACGASADSLWQSEVVTTRDGVVRAVVRGERPIDDLAHVGVLIKQTEQGRRIDVPAELGVALPLQDLAAGLLTSWARGTDLRDWATVMLMLSDVEFAEKDSSDYEILLEALWAASAGEELPEEWIVVARRLARG